MVEKKKQQKKQQDFQPNDPRINKDGRPKGVKNKKTIFLENMEDTDIETAFTTVKNISSGILPANSSVDAATALAAAKYIIDRCMRKGNPWKLELPDSPKKIKTAEDLEQEVNALRNARREGIISPEEQALELANLDSISNKMFAELERQAAEAVEGIKEK